MTKIIINPKFALLPNEVESLGALPENKPDAKYTAENTRLIEAVYYRVFAAIPDAASLLKLETSTKWNTGEKTKLIDAKRNLLQELQSLSHYTGLHESISPEYLLEAINTKRAGVLRLIPLVSMPMPE